LKLFADEAIDRQIVESLRSAGIDVTYAAETDAAVADDVLLQKASAQSRLFVTSDKDFGELVYRLGKATEGVLLLRLSGLSASAESAARGGGRNPAGGGVTRGVLGPFCRSTSDTQTRCPEVKDGTPEDFYAYSPYGETVALRGEMA